MMTRLLPSLVVTAVVFVAVLLSQNVAVSGQDAEAKEKTSEFDGKVVTVYLSTGSRKSGQILTDVKLIEVGGRMMITGTGADTEREDNWTTGVRIGLAWDSVQSYYAMTEEQYEKKVLEHQAH